MASDTLKRNNANGRLTPAAERLAELMDDDTEVAGSNPERNDGQEEEILVKWQMPGKLDLVAAKRQLNQLLATLMIAYPGRITIIDRKQQEWSYVETTPEESS